MEKKTIRLIFDAAKPEIIRESGSEVSTTVYRVPESQAIKRLEIRIPLNGGYAIELSYADGSQELLVFASKEELLEGISKLITSP